MPIDRKRAFKTQILLIYRQLWRRRGLWLRGLLCWAIGMGFLWAIPNGSFDTRFRLRGEQNPSKDIVLIYIEQAEWSSLLDQQRNWLRPMKEVEFMGDSFFWSPLLWEKILRKTLSYSPEAIGVAFHFTDLNLETKRRLLKSEIFMSPKVFFAAITDKNGDILAPSLARVFEDNIGSHEIVPDDDGVVRRFYSQGGYNKHLVARLSAMRTPEPPPFHSIETKESSLLINYQGAAGSYRSYNLSDLLNGQIPSKQLKNKIIIIGAKNTRNHTFMTPLGAMPRADILGHITDNQINQQWIQNPSWLVPALVLLLLLMIGIWLMNTLPQSVALVSLFWVGMGWTTFSFWIFDNYDIWLPILPPLVQLSVIYVVFLSYQLTISDYQKWQLEQESLYLREVEELKNNFVSLISHDLKTPIAKMQAICDRILSQYPDSGFSGDLISLRNESSELHRYIQTILQITRAESKDFKPNKDAADINKIIEEVVTRLSSLARERSISIKMHLEPMFLIEIDPVLIREVILNLIENAIKYSNDNSQITVNTEEINDHVLIRIKDQGVGIPQDDQDRIFEKFFRGRQENSSIKGSGLGLYLVKYFVELHRGVLSVKSEDNKGTEVTISLPTYEESELPTDSTRSIDTLE